MKRGYYLLILLLFGLPVFIGFSACDRQGNSINAKRVILIGVDGMSTDGFQQAITPNLDSLIANGAVSLHTRSVMPTVSAPNWGAILTGAGPEQNGITDNGWSVTNHSIEPTVSDDKGYFPSLFKMIKDKYPGDKTCMFYDWKGLGNIVNPDYIDKFELTEGFGVSFEKAASWIIKNKPLFSFVYIDSPDDYGHKYGWGTTKYIKRIEDIDSIIGKFIESLKKAGMYKDSYFIVVSDHGGKEKAHGGLSMDEIEVPWIISGPGIIKNKVIEQQNDLFNTAPTILFLLNIEQPDEWIGRPVLWAFKDKTALSSKNKNEYIPKPAFSIKSGIYPKAQLVEFTVSQPGCKIHFTLNGTDPDIDSPVYMDPVLLIKSATLKAAAFRNGSVSDISEIVFKRTMEVQSVDLKNKPSPDYFGMGGYSLINRKEGGEDFHNKEWLGFRGDNLEATLYLGNYKKEIKKVTIGCFNDENSWIFLPESVEVYTSFSGVDFIKVGSLSKEQIRKGIKPGRNEIQIAIPSSPAKYLKVVAGNRGSCPAGHPGEGEKCWLFVDEIIIE